MKLDLHAISKALDGRLVGDKDAQMTGVATLDAAGDTQVSFFANRKYLSQLKTTKAGLVILKEDFLSFCPTSALVVEDPYFAYAKLSHYFHQRPKWQPSIAQSALVSNSAEVSEGVYIGPGVVVSDGVKVGAGSYIGANTYLGESVVIGSNTRIDPQVTIHYGVKIGDDCHIQSQTVIGGDGFGFARHKEGWMPLAQLGSVSIGHRVHVGASTTIDRGALEDTRIGDDVIIDNQVQIAHNVVIGDRTAIAACAGVSGSTHIGADCTLAGQAGVVGHLKITSDVHLCAQAQVTRSISEPGAYASGTGVMPLKDWRKLIARWRRWYKQTETRSVES